MEEEKAKKEAQNSKVMEEEEADKGPRIARWWRGTREGGRT